MDKSKSKLTNVTIGLAIIIGSFIYNALSGIPQLPMAVNWIVTVIVSVTIHQIIFWFLNKIIEHSDLLLKLFWGKLYIKGFWSYTYIVDGEKKYGAWCIDQDLDSITIKGFGLSRDGSRRSDVQSVTSLIRRGNDFEVINMRRDVSPAGEWEDVFFYSKTTLHFHQRNTFMNFCPYPLSMDGNTIIYGGALSGKIHNQLYFTKHLNAKNEHDIEVIVKAMMND
jgi:hypothetical protein